MCGTADEEGTLMQAHAVAGGAGVRLHVVETGDARARPILFIHGAFSHPGHFAPWIEFFSAAGFACHAPALPGHQPSDPAALRTLTLKDYLVAMRRSA